MRLAFAEITHFIHVVIQTCFNGEIRDNSICIFTHKSYHHKERIHINQMLRALKLLEIQSTSICNKFTLYMICNMKTTSNFSWKWLMGQISKHQSLIRLLFIVLESEYKRLAVSNSRCLIHCFLKINFKLIDTHLKNGNSSICLSDGIYQQNIENDHSMW